MSNEESREVRTMYDPGPSGTAVAALIIALIALAVALHGAFRPVEIRFQMTDVQAARYAESVVKAEVAKQISEQAKPAPSDQAIRAVARDEISRVYLVPEPGLDSGAEPGSNEITLPARKELHFRRTQ